MKYILSEERESVYEEFYLEFGRLIFFRYFLRRFVYIPHKLFHRMRHFVHLLRFVSVFLQPSVDEALEESQSEY